MEEEILRNPLNQDWHQSPAVGSEEVRARKGRQKELEGACLPWLRGGVCHVR